TNWTEEGARVSLSGFKTVNLPTNLRDVLRENENSKHGKGHEHGQDRYQEADDLREGILERENEGVEVVVVLQITHHVHADDESPCSHPKVIHELIHLSVFEE